MAGYGSDRWRTRRIAGLAIVAVAAGSFGFVLRTKGLQYAANLTQLASVLLGLVIPLLAWSRRPPTGSSAEQIHQAQETLAGLVKGQWKLEAEARGLGSEPIPVRWRLSDRPVMDHGRRVMPGIPSFSGSSDQIDPLVKQFRDLLRRRLVILGDAGAGKTTLAVQLLLALLKSRQETEPVPVLLSLSRWDTRAHRSLRDWLAVRLGEDYPALRAADDFGVAAPRELARQSRVLPILDGLDELTVEARNSVLAALNNLTGEDQEDQVILTCRGPEYSDTVRGFTGAAVIEADPLTPKEAADYLEDYIAPAPGDPWHTLLKALRDGTAPGLAAALSTPLGLWLLRTVYPPGANPERLLDLVDPALFPDRSSILAHLFDRLIPALINTHPKSSDPAELFRPRHKWDSEKVRCWMEFLADSPCAKKDRANTTDRALLTAKQKQAIEYQEATPDFAWWQLAHGTLDARAVRLATGLAFGLGFWLAVGLAAGLAAGLAFGLGVSLAFGLALGSATWLGDAPSCTGLPALNRIPLFIRRLTGHLGYGLAGGLAAGLAFGPRIGLAFGLGVALGVGLTFAIAHWLEDTHSYADLRVRKRVHLIFPELKSQVPYALGVGLIVGLMFTFGLEFGLRRGLTIGLAVGLTLGIAFTLIGWAERQDESAAASTPISTLRADRTLTLLRSSAVGISAGIGFGLAFGPLAGLAGGFVCGLSAGLSAGRMHAWPIYKVAAIRLAVARKLPFRLMAFLDDAHRLGLLRMAGPVYQFRHADLRRHLRAVNRSPN